MAASGCFPAATHPQSGSPDVLWKTTADPSTHHPQAEKRLGPRSLRMTTLVLLRTSGTRPWFCCELQGQDTRRKRTKTRCPEGIQGNDPCFVANFRDAALAAKNKSAAPRGRPGGAPEALQLQEKSSSLERGARSIWREATSHSVTRRQRSATFCRVSVRRFFWRVLWKSIYTLVDARRIDDAVPRASSKPGARSLAEAGLRPYQSRCIFQSASLERPVRPLRQPSHHCPTCCRSFLIHV
jgi:hypothetical protein